MDGDDVLELDEQDILEDEDEAHEPVEGEDTPGEVESDEPELVTFGDDTEEVQADGTPLVKHLRQQLREKERELSQYRRAPTEEPIVVGDKPTLESCEYDEARFDTELDAWHNRKRQRETQEQRAQEAKRKQDEAWSQVTSNYASKKAALRFSDKDDVEAVAFDALSPVSQAIIAKVAANPAMFIYAAGKNPARLAELAKIDDPLLLAATVARLEATVQVKKRGARPDVDTPVRGKPIAQGADKELERLEREADRTGDRTAVIRYRRDKAKKQP